MGYAARNNAKARSMGATPERVVQGRSGPRLYSLRMTDTFGPIYRWVTNIGAKEHKQQRRIALVVPKVRGKAARRQDKAARRLARLAKAA